MSNENLQAKINRLSYDELARLLMDVADNPVVRDHIVNTLETPQLIQHERGDSVSTTRTAPPPYSSASSLIRRYSLARNWHYGRVSQTPVVHVPSASQPTALLTTRPCVCKNCKQVFWSHEQSSPVTNCVGHPGTLERLHRVITSRQKRRLVEDKYLDGYSGQYKCWTCCLQKKSAPGCSAFDHHVAA